MRRTYFPVVQQLTSFRSTYLNSICVHGRVGINLRPATRDLFWQVERERSEKNKALLEKEEYRAHIHKLARALKRHQA